MLINTDLTLTGERLVLVPYREEHVPVYHEWMVSHGTSSSGSFFSSPLRDRPVHSAGSLRHLWPRTGESSAPGGHSVRAAHH